MVGIDRVHIISSWRCNYLDICHNCEPAANALYPAIFAGLKMPLSSADVGIIEATKEEAMARYDWKEGIDVILHFANGGKATMQEKFLTYTGRYGSTLTVETEKSGSHAPGAWYYCTAQYYFVGYAKRYKQGDYSFQDWMLVDWPMLHRIDAATRLPWIAGQCWKEADSKFRFLQFDDVPATCVVARRPIQKTLAFSYEQAPPPGF